MHKLHIPVVLIVVLTACGESSDSSTRDDSDARLSTAEAFIDAFYSFDPSQLGAFLSSAEDSASSIIYYQGWAEGGNYKIVDRQACVVQDTETVSCSITVEDDPLLVLGIDFNVTDTFAISFAAAEISAVETSSNDIQLYYDARDWVREKLPELVEEPCQGYFAGGPTPADCARAMAEGYRRFAASVDFPRQ